MYIFIIGWSRRDTTQKIVSSPHFRTVDRFSLYSNSDIEQNVTHNKVFSLAKIRKRERGKKRRIQTKSALKTRNEKPKVTIGNIQQTE